MKLKVTLFFLACCLIPFALKAQDPKLTEDWSRKPPVIQSGKRMKAPSDAIILFKKGKDISNWTNRKGEPAGWKKGCMKMKPITMARQEQFINNLHPLLIHHASLENGSTMMLFSVPRDLMRMAA